MGYLQHEEKVIVLDTEFLALPQYGVVEPRAVVTSIGLTWFNTGDTKLTGADLLQHSKRFRFDVQEQLDIGRKVSADTLHWWAKQPEGMLAAEVNDPVNNPRDSVVSTLCQLNEWILELGTNPRPRIFASPNTVDIPILSSLYEDFKIKAPFVYNQTHNAASLIRTFGDYEDWDVPFPHKAHDARYDAINTAWQLNVAIRRICDVRF